MVAGAELGERPQRPGHPRQVVEVDQPQVAAVAEAPPDGAGPHVGDVGSRYRAALTSRPRASARPDAGPAAVLVESPAVVGAGVGDHRRRSGPAAAAGPHRLRGVQRVLVDHACRGRMPAGSWSGGVEGDHVLRLWLSQALQPVQVVADVHAARPSPRSRAAGSSRRRGPPRPAAAGRCRCAAPPGCCCSGTRRARRARPRVGAASSRSAWSGWVATTTRREAPGAAVVVVDLGAVRPRAGWPAPGMPARTDVSCLAIRST